MYWKAFDGLIIKCVFISSIDCSLNLLSLYIIGKNFLLELV